MRQIYENCQRSVETEIRNEVDSIPSFAGIPSNATWSLGARHLLTTAQYHYQNQKTNQEMRLLLEMMQDGIERIFVGEQMLKIPSEFAIRKLKIDRIHCGASIGRMVDIRKRKRNENDSEESEYCEDE